MARLERRVLRVGFLNHQREAFYRAYLSWVDELDKKGRGGGREYVRFASSYLLQ